ncbi:TPM domain-containing protein [Sphingobacterium sp. SYP-B4668]|uniref:TPM domain-containing protein n=1 Tax=Sphingobacterium sp. SYP-B4668 TaxID=2996035 RepID=UPI0022DE0FA8|nr:TPM domain-containing protein [Sphingobacterium sp. SYP-B4668]
MRTSSFQRIIIFIIFLLGTCSTFAQYSIEQVPNPKEKGQNYFISNPDAILRSDTEQLLNEMAVEIEVRTKAEVAIVVVGDFEGDDDFQFAHQLFNTWGIGKAEANNGLLLFIGTNRHYYRFITGYGMEAILPDAYLKRIGEEFLVPHFKNSDYDAGVLAAMGVIKQALLTPDATKELDRIFKQNNSFWFKHGKLLQQSGFVVFLFLIAYLIISVITKTLVGPLKIKKGLHPLASGCGCFLVLMFISIFVFAFGFNNIEEVFRLRNLPIFLAILGSLVVAMKYNDGRNSISNSYKDEESKLQALSKFSLRTFIPMLLAPLALFDFFSIMRSNNKTKVRFVPPDNTGDWERLNKDTNATKELNKNLDKGQLTEQRIASRVFEHWRNKKNYQIKIIGFNGAQADDYEICPKCQYLTYSKPYVDTIKQATYSSSGLGMEKQDCKNCHHKSELGEVIIPIKVRSTSSGSSSSSGGSGSRSSSGSFGGGSSGGGGAGGRW